jgi:hypothetical protein
MPRTKRDMGRESALVLIAHSFFLQRDPKQHERQKPLLTAEHAPRRRDAEGGGHSVTLFDATFLDGPEAFEPRSSRAVRRRSC